MFRKLIIAAACAALSASSVFAADLPPVFKAPAPVVASGPWSGFYAGVNIAGAMTNGAFDFVTIPGTGNIHPTGIMPGITVGAGIWYGAAYFGIEADAAYDFIKTDNTCVVVLDCKIKSSFFMTERLIIGMPLSAMTGATLAKATAATGAWPVPLSLPQSAWAANLMPYATGGIAERRIEACVDSQMLGMSQGCAKEWLIGVAGGGGFRLPVSTNVSLDLSVIYVNYNKSFVPASTTPIFPGTFIAKNEVVGKFAILGHF